MKSTEASLAFCRRILGITGILRSKIIGVYGCAERYSYKGNHPKDQSFVGHSFALRCEKEKISNLSGGMKRRVGIAQAMLNDPEILVMDEPTAGLDPGERVRLRNFISEFSHDRIVLISTHIVSDIEYISTRNAIMKAGEIVDVGTTAELVKRIEGKVWNCIIPTSKLPECEMRLRIINQRGEDHNQVSIRYLSEHSEIDGAVTTEPRLEDLYLWLFPQTDLEKEDR